MLDVDVDVDVCACVYVVHFGLHVPNIFVVCNFSIRAKLNVSNENCLVDATDEDKIVMERTISSTC